MHAVEFQAPIKNGAVCLPKNYKNLYENQEVQVFIIPIKDKKVKHSFDPREFFGVAKISKDKVDQYLQSTKSEWDDYLDEK